MKLNAESLKNHTEWEKAGISVPEYDIDAVREKTVKEPSWIHFGAGNIFRIFIGGIADTLIENGYCDKGIICAETFDFDVIERIYKPYDNLVLAVTLKADGGMDKRVLASLSEGITAEDKDRLWEIFKSKSLQMISFTITEKGYALKNAAGEYFPFVTADLEGEPRDASSAPAIVCAALYERYKACAAPIAVVSMDNCSHNGEKLRSSVLTVAAEWRKRGKTDDGFTAYVSDENRVSFPWTMIDKITPRPSEAVKKELEKCGVEDMNPITTSKNTYIAPFVNAEAPQYLVIEDNFPNGRPPLEKAGVYMTDRDTVNKVERMKVTTCLNPLHTALAVYGCLLGYKLIADEMRDSELNSLVRAIAYKEGMEVVTDPGILSPKDFVNEVLTVRLPNPFMPDTPQRIATDTSQKVGIRYGETIKSYVEKYGDAKRLKYIPLAIAGWLRYLLGIDDEGKEFELSPDPMLDELKAALDTVTIGGTSIGALSSVLSNESIFGCDLYKAGIGETVEGFFRELIKAPGAVRGTLKKYV